MKLKRQAIALTVLAVLLLSVGGTAAQDSQPAGQSAITATVASAISYQGVLTDAGSPVTGVRDMVFRLYSDDACTTQVGSDIAMPGVPVNDGVFSVVLPVDAASFDGRGLWLEVGVGDDTLVCMELLPVPYALSLRPGAVIQGEEDTSLYVRSTTSSGATTGLVGRSDSSTDWATGVRGHASATSGQTYGIRGYSASTSGRGVAGHASATSGVTYGVSGTTNSSTDWATGVIGYSTASTGQTYGVAGYNYSSGDYSAGVRAYSSATAGRTFGVIATSESDYTGAAGVYGRAFGASAQTYGIRGDVSSTSGWGAVGFASATSGNTRGVYGRSDSDTGVGVYGEATDDGGWTFGVRGTAESYNGIGVYGYTGNGWSTGVKGETSSPDGKGVAGYATATTGKAYGVFGETASTQDGAAAVRGQATATTGETVGVTGVTYSNDTWARGVHGLAAGSAGGTFGVWGQSNSPDGFGVYGTSGGSGYAGYFWGDVHVNGTLTKSGGSFKIDHPLDPENQYLSHAFVESPDMMNVYNGNVVLDENGQAWVDLPDYFEALNRDYRYQLTCIGGFAPVYIAQEIADNRFQIAGGEPGLKISWQVTGIRQDPWANANRIPVEEAKGADERGYYLNPELYGQPPSMGLHAPPDVD